MNILLVEDNPAQAAAVENAMQESGHRISKVNCGDSAMRFLRSNEVDLVMLDWQLRGTTGLEVLQWIRGNLGREQAVLFLTARLSEADIVQALEAGADDYVVKPFRADELAARAGALLHRTTRNENTAKAVSVGSYILDRGRRTVSLHDTPVELTAKEFDMAAYLFANVGRVVSRDLFAKLVWGRELDITSRTVDTHIYRLRRKLFLHPDNGVCLSTVYTHGYRLDEVALTTATSDAFARQGFGKTVELAARCSNGSGSSRVR
ncbi:winged helix family two component transcriptional regulator [Paraburkholderia sp. RAU2J]|uniref:response regulator transcription factor n=1 Tax=Paraburkholderia sp. RAU2J TaxID=1938810 RepID=UPI000EB571CD|nr:response regulator transcription factor [Paraburkholderia sp. RAU2J]RKT13719.1 winged helix family two component transcriptional regulator [Paraburkholderia sp. RAU2J]